MTRKLKLVALTLATILAVLPTENSLGATPSPKSTGAKAIDPHTKDVQHKYVYSLKLSLAKYYVQAVKGYFPQKTYSVIISFNIDEHGYTRALKLEKGCQDEVYQDAVMGAVRHATLPPPPPELLAQTKDRSFPYTMTFTIYRLSEEPRQTAKIGAN